MTKEETEDFMHECVKEMHGHLMGLDRTMNAVWGSVSEKWGLDPDVLDSHVKEVAAQAAFEFSTALMSGDHGRALKTMYSSIVTGFMVAFAAAQQLADPA